MSLDTKDPPNPDSELVQNEEESQITLYKRLIEYKNNLFKIDTLISLEKDSDTIQELRSLRTNLVEAISYQEETIKLTQKSEEFIYSSERVEPHYVDRYFILKKYIKNNENLESVKVGSKKTKDGIMPILTKWILKDKKLMFLGLVIN